MIRTKNGIIVKPRMTGHEMSLPLPKDVHVDKNAQYLIQSKDGSHIQATRTTAHQNPFADFTPNLTKYHNKMKKSGFYGISKNKGREL